VARAVGAIAVILFHAIPSARDYGFRSDWIFYLSGWGYQGVDLFFVISGFVMILTETRRERRPGAFLLDRIGRIAPTYWFVTTLLFLLLLSFGGLFRTMSADPELYLRSMSFTNFLFARHTAPLIFVGWTLEYEMLLYLVFAATLFIGGWSKRLLCSAILLLLLATSNIASPILFEFLFGQVCALIYLSGWRLPARTLLLVMGVILLCLPQGDAITVQGDGLRVIFYGLPAALVVLAISQAGQSHNRLMILIGDASYSIYLAQVFSIAFCCKLLVRMAPGARAEWVVLVAIVGTVLTGFLLFTLVERPITRVIGRMRQISSRSGPGTPIAAAENP